MNDPTKENRMIFTLAIRAAVAEYGANHIYEKPADLEQCLYVHNVEGGEPDPDDSDDQLVCGCLIGAATHKAGVPLSSLLRWNIIGVTSLFEELREHGDLPFEVSPAEEYAAEAAQNAQDAGGTWGEALAVYETELALAEQGYIDGLSGADG